MLTVAEKQNLCAGIVSHLPQEIDSEEDRLAMITAGYDADLVMLLCILIPLLVEVCQLKTAYVLKEEAKVALPHLPIDFACQFKHRFIGHLYPTPMATGSCHHPRGCSWQTRMRATAKGHRPQPFQNRTNPLSQRDSFRL